MNKKIILIIIPLLILLVIVIKNGIVNMDVKFKEVTLELNSNYPTNINYYIDTKLDNCKVDIQTINKTVGKDNYEVICGEKKYKGNLTIVDTKDPLVISHKHFITKDKAFNQYDHIYYNSENIKNIAIGKVEELKKLLSEKGDYKYPVNIVDSSNNVTGYNIGIEVIEENITKILKATVSTDEQVNFSDNTIKVEYMFIIGEDDKILNYADVITTYEYTSEDYIEAKKNIKANTFNEKVGQVVTDETNNLIIFQYELKGEELKAVINTITT